MNETFSTKAIMLNRQDFRENDVKVSVFCSERGRLELVARGAKKNGSKLAGHIEPITLSNIMIVRGKKFDYLGSAINEDAFIDIKDDFDKIIAAGKGINVFKKLVKENEKDEELFNLLKNYLIILNTVGAEHYSVPITQYNNLLLNFFILKLLSKLGYKPELYNCVICKKKITPNNNKFDFTKGGVVCGGCVITDKRCKCPLDKGGLGDFLLIISDNCIKVLRMVVDNDLEKLIKLKIDKKLEKEVEKIISSFYQYNFM